ncbi:ATP-dependent sacrificial sulfur transferase LarE [Paenibacillus sp. IB182496]|uniref:ATP-dependent sacrificial sulfur transferase LarE n=1 Tax=Paenibacillus sabuli TaxID=2772509 RepID=A0A927GRT0_9BACL|nr:ATP-dependent sacrificial sulfur transferase LarE [Paenibacillus sabuli]MBD2844997.1 ATP-dependent sacrificial sulfur transferase LarE [Paenibacillus sabuli]
MLQQKHDKLKALLGEMDSVVVAFSGGIDSTLLLKVALDTLGPDRVLAVTADSETYPARELEEARTLAAQLQARHEVVYTSELEIPGYKENTPNRCYFCKRNLFEELLPLLAREGFSNVAFGLIADDMGEHRPGVKAARELNVRGPLQEAGLGKEEIRALARELGLPNWDKPSFACLSSRIAYGEEITVPKLTRVDRAELYLQRLGFRQVRVRVHGEMARIEVEPAEMARLLEVSHAATEYLQGLGFQYVTMDLTGYKSGSMNRVLGAEAQS